MQSKRLITILLIVAISLFGVLAASAAGTSEVLEVSVEMSPASGTLTDDLCIVAQGDTVNVDVTIDQNPGFALGQFFITYDPAVLTPVMSGEEVAYTLGADFANAKVTNPSAGLVQVTVMDPAYKNITATGNVISLSFTIPTGIECGEATIILDRADVSFTDENWDMLSPVVHDANEADYHGATAYFHNYGTPVVEEATCSSAEKITRTCTCGDVLVTYGEGPLPHKYDEVVTAPSCNSEGYTTGTCGLCGHTEVYNYTPKTEHSYTNTVIAPTCTSAGATNHVCDICGDKYTSDVVEALGHDHIFSEELSSESTCKINGYNVFVCACGDQEITMLPLAAHKYVETVIKPTCTTAGYTAHSCEVCGEYYEDALKSANGHSYNKTAEVAPKCETMGQTTYTCSACKDSYTVYADALGHNYVGVVTTPATCTKAGVETFTCSGCKDAFEVAIPEIGHDYADGVIYAPTCTEKGFTVVTCKNCTDSHVVDFVDAAGHKYIPVTIVKETCTQSGYTVFECACGDKYEGEFKDMLAHEYNSVKTDATCVEGGYTTYTCKNCPATYVHDFTAPKGHSFTSAVTAPTCTAEGYTTYTCACGHVEVRDPKPMTKHEYNTVVTEATCVEGGYTTYTCKHCGFVADRVPTAPAGHSYQATVTAPTCTSMGYTTNKCSKCNDEFLSELKDVLPHNISDDVDVTAPTCTTIGFSVYSCTDCEYSYVADYVSAKGHKYENPVVTAPTCTTMGFTTSTCACGAKVVDTYVDAVGHKFEGTVTAPTCTTMGYTTFTCACGETYKGEYVDAKGHTAEEIPAVEPTYKAEGATAGEKCSVCDVVLEEPEVIAKKSTAWIWITVICSVVVIGGVVAAVIIIKKKKQQKK